MKMIRGEWRSIFHSKILWISVAVMILIPFLYSVFFLTSVWDPYGDTKNLPVAVVNEDKPVTYQGKRLAVGEEMVKNIKKNDQLGWHFVSADEAQAGLANHKYYTVVTIPANFSKHATTVTSKHPQKMKLHYSTNASLNYIAKVISDAGATQLNQNVRASVTKAYALAMFKQVKTAGKGFSKAADGAKQLKNGGVVLQDGLTTYTTGVHTLKDGTTELNTKVQQLPAGIAKLANGGSALKTGLDSLNGSTGELASGVSKLVDGSGQVTSGLNTMNNSTGALASGVTELNNGAKSMNVGIVQYTDGVYELRSGLSQMVDSKGELRQKVTLLESGTKQVSDGVGAYTGVVSQVNEGANGINGGLSQLKTSTEDLPTQAKQMATGASTISGIIDQLAPTSILVNTGVTGMTQKLPEAQSQISQLQTSMDQLIELLNAEKAAGNGANTEVAKVMTDLQAQIKSLPTTSATTTNGDTVNQKIDAVAAKDGLTQSQVDDLKSSLNDNSNQNNSQDNTAAITAIQSDMTKLSQIMDAQATASSKAPDSVAIATEINEGVKGLVTQVDNLKPQLTELNTATSGMEQGLTGIQQGAKDLSSGLDVLNTKVPGMVTGINTMSDVSDQVVTGTNGLVGKSKKLNEGASGVDSGVNALDKVLSGAIQTLYGGTQQLTDKTPELKSGASQLAAGTAQLNQQVPTLVSGVSQLFNGSKQVTGGLQTLNGKVPALVTGVQQLDTGAGQLNTGLQTLQGSTGQLTSGVQQLADGASQLDANSAKLLSGNKKIKDGNATLAKSLKSGADTVNATPLKNSNAQMFATPSKLTHSNYSYVPNYGHALAPYVLSLALYVGAIVFNFAYPIRRMSDDDGTPTQWFLSKVAVGAPVAVLMALIECVALLIVGLKPISMAGYFTTAIMIALASMFIVMFLSMLFDNPGRFVAMVLLMLQLGGSGGTFPMEITNHFFNVIHPFLPLTYSILAFRQSLTGGWGNGTFVSSIVILAIFAIVSLILLWASMVFLKQHNMQELAEEPIKMKAGK
ncbi:YhgE/Pip family protein [Lactiplantibacillus pingfangensis]|uniref:YhgE/Pip family protein n=1 Tax=Lactiplantibacillus pingfangensis TaxID=2559915 RepID=UPI0039C97484